MEEPWAGWRAALLPARRAAPQFLDLTGRSVSCINTPSLPGPPQPLPRGCTPAHGWGVLQLGGCKAQTHRGV